MLKWPSYVTIISLFSSYIDFYQYLLTISRPILGYSQPSV